MKELLQSDEITKNGRVVFDSGKGERTCVLARHFHGTRRDIDRFAHDPDFRKLFYEHQNQVLGMVRALLAGLVPEPQLILEGVRRDLSRPTPVDFDRIRALEARNLVDPIEAFSEERRARWFMDELERVLLELDEDPPAPPVDGFFTNYDIDQTLAGFRAAALLEAGDRRNRLVGIEPTPLDLAGMVQAVTGELPLSLSPEQKAQVSRQVQASKDRSIVQAMTVARNGIVVIGASHTKHGSPTPEVDCNPLEDLLEEHGIRVIVLEPHTIAWNY